MFMRPCQETGTNQLWEIKNMVLNSLLYTPVVEEFLITVKSCHLLLSQTIIYCFTHEKDLLSRYNLFLW